MQYRAIESKIIENYPLKLHTTLKAGGNAEKYVRADDLEELAAISLYAQKKGIPTTILGSGSNVLPSDQGVSGLVVHNLADKIDISPDGEVVADTGCNFQDLFLKTAQAGLYGHEYAVGIPGTLGGALVSNAGAYRSNVSEFLAELEIVESGERRWVSPDWMEFEYRNSILRRSNPPQCTVLRVRFKMEKGDKKAVFDEARDYQRQRISKQPPPASAGSFFKNVNDPELACRVPGIPEPLQKAGVTPAAFLLIDVGLKGFTLDGAKFAEKHNNFIVNIGGASATAIRNLANYGKFKVYEKYGILLEEEVLYLGNWEDYRNPYPIDYEDNNNN